MSFASSPHIDYISAPNDSLAGSLLTIDLHAMADNYRFMASKSDKAECAAVVKADAYGTGLERAAQTFHDAGCKTFFVALPQEGIRLRKLLPEVTIYVLNGLVGDASQACLSAYQDHALRPVLGSYEELDLWEHHCKSTATALPCAIHFDTGMNRLGLTQKAAHALSDRWSKDAPSFTLSLIISHLACADEPDHPMNEEQLSRFRAIRSLFPTVPASLANSGGVFLGPDYHFDLMRPGIALYGGKPVGNQPNPMKTVVTLQSRILMKRSVPKGWSVSYGAGETTKRDSSLATINIGYADGYHRAAGSSDHQKGASVWIDGYKAPIMGRVTMDLSIIDITDIPQGVVQRGEWVELFGQNIALDDVATHAGTISYELLTSLGLRAHRRYL